MDCLFVKSQLHWVTESTGVRERRKAFTLLSQVPELMSPVSELVKKTGRMCMNSDIFMLVMLALGVGRGLVGRGDDFM